MDSVPLTWEAVGGICALLAIIGSAFGVYLAVVDRRQASEMAAIKDGAAADTKAAKESLQRDVDAAHDALRDLKDEHVKRLDAHAAARAALEDRLRIVEREYVTRADHAQFRAELVAALDKVGDRVAGSMDKLRADLRDDFHSMNKRVAALERHE